MDYDIFLYKRNRDILKNQRFSISQETLNFILNKLPKENRAEAKKVWLSRCDQTILDVNREQMEEYLSSLKPLFTDEEKQIFNSLNIDILPGSSQFNASSHNIEKTVLIHEALPHIFALFCHYFSKSSSKGKNYLTHPLAYREFIYYLAHILIGKPIRIQSLINLNLIYPDTEEDWKYSQQLTVACVQFVILHELGHIKAQDGLSRNKLENHLMEYAADRFAFDKCMQMCVLGEETPDLHCFAPLFALSVMSLWDYSESGTHPSTNKRIEKMKDHYRNIKGFPVEVLTYLFDFADQVIATMEFMREDFEETMDSLIEGKIVRYLDLSREAIAKKWLMTKIKNDTWEYWMGKFSPYKLNNFGI